MLYRWQNPLRVASQRIAPGAAALAASAEATLPAPGIKRPCCHSERSEESLTLSPLFLISSLRLLAVLT